MTAPRWALVNRADAARHDDSRGRCTWLGCTHRANRTGYCGQHMLTAAQEQRRADLIEDIEWIAEEGMTAVCERLGVKAKTVEAILTRGGRRDLLQRLRARDWRVVA